MPHIVSDPHQEFGRVFESDPYAGLTRIAAKRLDELLLDLLARTCEPDPASDLMLVTDAFEQARIDAMRLGGEMPRLVQMTGRQCRAACHAVSMMRDVLGEADIEIPDALAEAGLALDAAA